MNTGDAARRRVMRFIALLKGHQVSGKETACEITREIFLNGGCYRLYQILKFVFPDAVACKADFAETPDRTDSDGNSFVLSHVVTRIGDRFYDIDGEFILVATPYVRMAKMTPRDHDIAAGFCYSFARRGPIPV